MDSEEFASRAPGRLIKFAVVGAVVAALTALGGRTDSIHEFCPERLEIRYCNVYRFPLFNCPVFKSSWASARGPDLITYMEGTGCLEPRPDARRHWYRVYHGSTTWRGGASDFTRCFEWWDAQIIQWAQDNPRLAAEVFADVAQVIYGCREERDLDSAAALIKVAIRLRDEDHESLRSLEFYRDMLADIQEEMGITFSEVPP